MLIASLEWHGSLEQSEERCFQEEDDPYLNDLIFNPIASSILYYQRELMN